jgi:hypothetical protein
LSVARTTRSRAGIRLAGALLSEQNDEWLVQRHYLSVESMQLTLDAGQYEESSLEQQQHRRRSPSSTPPEKRTSTPTSTDR